MLSFKYFFIYLINDNAYVKENIKKLKGIKKGFCSLEIFIICTFLSNLPYKAVHILKTQ